MSLKIGIVLYADAEELDWAGPYEVFSMAAMGQEMEVFTVAESLEAVRQTNHLALSGHFLGHRPLGKTLQNHDEMHERPGTPH